MTTGEELMTPVSLRGCRSAVKVILIVPLEAPFLKLCQQQPSSLKQIKKTLEGSIIFYFKTMNGFFFKQSSSTFFPTNYYRIINSSQGFCLFVFFFLVMYQMKYYNGPLIKTYSKLINFVLKSDKYS